MSPSPIVTSETSARLSINRGHRLGEHDTSCWRRRRYEKTTILYFGVHFSLPPSVLVLCEVPAMSSKGHPPPTLIDDGDFEQLKTRDAEAVRTAFVTSCRKITSNCAQQRLTYR